jgi:CBS domain containing-hemolysin-like protein
MFTKLLAFVLFGVAVGLAGLFTGSEIGMYQLSPLRLRLGVQRRATSFQVLGHLMQDKSALLLSILIGTTLSQYLAAGIVTRAFLSHFESEHTVEFVTTLVTAPILFVCGDLIPKNLFYYRADVLMPIVSYALYVFHCACTWSGVIQLLKAFSQALGRLMGISPSTGTTVGSWRRHHVRVFLQETREEGILSPMQTNLIGRIVGIPKIHVRSVMTPINRVATLDIYSDRDAVIDKFKECNYTRLLVTGHATDCVIGYINVYKVLDTKAPFRDLTPFVKSLKTLDANVLVVDSINTLRNENEHIALVTRCSRGGRTKPIGIITMHDLLEELLVNVR